jgi:hypothetical protein
MMSCYARDELRWAIRGRSSSTILGPSSTHRCPTAIVGVCISRKALAPFTDISGPCNCSLH